MCRGNAPLFIRRGLLRLSGTPDSAYLLGMVGGTVGADRPHHGKNGDPVAKMAMR